MNVLVLASASPRRQKLLATLHNDFTILAVDLEEKPFPNERPSHYVSRLAEEKAAAGLTQLNSATADTWVLGADTIVVSSNSSGGQEILEKPQDYSDFVRMMTLLSGREHKVMTAICLMSKNKVFVERVETKVNFRPLSTSDIEDYWQTGEPKDKAGGYGIQGQAARFVKKIAGSYSAVVGLPLCETEALLRHVGFPCRMLIEGQK